MNLKNIKAVGGFYRYGFSLYPMSQHDFDCFDSVNFDKGISAASEQVLALAEEHCGGHKLPLEEIIIQDGLIVFCDINRSWLIAYATDFQRFMTWCRFDGALTADQYEKQLAKKPYERSESED